MHSRRRASALILTGLFGAPALAQVEVEGGHVFPPRADVAGRTLQLNGVGYRAVAWFKGYAAALYLPRKVRSTEEVLALEGPKRIQMKMLVDVPAQEFVKAFGKGVNRNTPAAEIPVLRERMAEFDGQVGGLVKVRKGDLVDLDYVPARGLVFVVNGVERGRPLPGEDLYRALLRIFLGERPVDKELKAGMLGGPLA
jgi:hypothetical protein